MLFLLTLTSTLFTLQTVASTANKVAVDQKPILPDPSNSENQTYKLLVHEGFYFGNPSTDCKYASQPYIYSEYKKWSENNDYITKMLSPDVDFTIVGHTPVSGHYHDLKHFYVNALWRIAGCVTEVYPELLRITLLHIHGGCNEEWSVQEVHVEGRANNGVDFDIVNVWITRWHDGKIPEVRTYIDAGVTNILLYQNEGWTNSTTQTDHTTYLPGPRGMPDMVTLAEFLAKGEHY